MDTSKCDGFDNSLECDGVIEWLDKDTLYGCQYNKKCQVYQIKDPLKLLTKYETESKEIRESISKAARSGERDKIKQLMARGPKLQKKISILRSYLEKNVKSPRPECSNNLCDLHGFKDGLEDPMTTSCEDPKDLIKLSDDYCYSISPEGIKKYMGDSSGREPKKNMINLDYTLKDYLTMLPKDGRIYYYNQKYNSYFYQYRDLDFDLQEDELRVGYRYRVDEYLKTGGEITKEYLEDLSEMLANSNGIDLEMYCQWVGLDEMIDLFAIDENLREYERQTDYDYLNSHPDNMENLLIKNVFVQLIIDGNDIDELVRKGSKTHKLTKEKYKELVDYDYVYQILHPEIEFRTETRELVREVYRQRRRKQELKDKMKSLLENDFPYYYQALERLGFLRDSLDDLEKIKGGELPNLRTKSGRKEFRSKYIDTEKRAHNHTVLWSQLDYLKLLYYFSSSNDIIRENTIKPSFLYFKDALGNSKPKKDKYLFLDKFKKHVDLMSESIKDLEA